MSGRERPILFGGEMVRAILDGRKTQTRRILKPQPPGDARMDSIRADGAEVGFTTKECVSPLVRCPHGQPGDRLWVRESAYIAPPKFGDDADCNMKDDQGRPRVVGWAANMDSDGVRAATDYGVKCTPSIFMPRWASRLTLEITGVRVERLQMISGADILAEGIADAGEHGELIEVDRFVTLWDTINGKRAPWAGNPWVWVVEFQRVLP